jgi:hypothetical protein
MLRTFRLFSLLCLVLTLISPLQSAQSKPLPVPVLLPAALIVKLSPNTSTQSVESATEVFPSKGLS